jgi:hypothetical protein
MTNDIIIGLLLIGITVGLSVFLLIFCRSVINRIDKKNLSSLHDIMKGIYREETP